MSIKLDVTQEQKMQMANLVTECGVLNNLLKERRDAIENKVKEILASNALSPKLYALKFNISKDLWEAELGQGVLTLPGDGIKPGAKLN